MSEKNARILLILFATIFLIGCSTTPAAVQTTNTAEINDPPTETKKIAANQKTAVTPPTCAQPTPENAPSCLQMEEAILATTVRLELYRWLDADGQRGEFIDGGSSHGTIMDGRYLVTHNHFGELFVALRNQGIPGEYIRLSIYKADGELILSNIPMMDLAVIGEDSQTIVLAFEDAGGLGFFEARGYPSAEFKSWQSLPLQPGTEVAQIDWDGITSYVKWTTIDNIRTEDDIPQIELRSYVKQGSSGGGIFWNGVHIANNWFRAREQNKVTGDVLDEYSMAALNTVQITAVAAADHSLA